MNTHRPKGSTQHPETGVDLSALRVRPHASRSDASGLRPFQYKSLWQGVTERTSKRAAIGLRGTSPKSDTEGLSARRCKRPSSSLNNSGPLHLQVEDSSGTGSILRIRLSDHTTERIVDLKNFATTGYYSLWFAVAPDDSPIMLRNAGTRDVYSLDWEAL